MDLHLVCLGWSLKEDVKYQQTMHLIKSEIRSSVLLDIFAVVVTRSCDFSKTVPRSSSRWSCHTTLVSSPVGFLVIGSSGALGSCSDCPACLVLAGEGLQLRLNASSGASFIRNASFTTCHRSICWTIWPEKRRLIFASNSRFLYLLNLHLNRDCLMWATVETTAE